MSNNTLRSTVLIASTLVALASGTGLAAAQVVDNPPGSAFQDQGIREDNGLPRFGENNGAAAYGSYGYAQRRTVANGHHRAVTRQQRDQWSD